MYDSVIPVTEGHDPIVVEGSMETQVLLFNAGPSAIKATVWQTWYGKEEGTYSKNSEQPTLELELRAGDQRVVSGAFIRVKLKKGTATLNLKASFSAVGARFLVRSSI